MSKAELDTFNLFDINFNAFFLQPLNPSAGSTVTECINPKPAWLLFLQPMKRHTVLKFLHPLLNLGLLAES